MDYRIEALSDNNLKDVQQLYASVFNNTYSIDFIKKKFDTSYLQKNHFGHLAYYKEQAVAFHGAIPVKMRHNNKTEIAAQYGDAMTLPEHTGRGLFTTLGEYTDILLKKAGITFVWGFPNQNSQYGYLNKLDWEYTNRMQGFSIKTATLPIEKILRKTKISQKIHKQHIEKIFSKYKVDKHLRGSAFLNKDIVSVDRNTTYYTYKNFNNNFVIEIFDTLFWVKIKNGLLVGDIQISTGEKFYKALSKLKKMASSCGIHEIVFQSSPDTLIERLLKSKKNKHFESWVIGYKNFSSEFPLEKLTLTFGDLDTF